MAHPLTQREVRNLLAEAGLRPRRRLGQHFLVDPNLLGILVREADLGPRDVVLEVGAGLGNLTDLLVEAAGRVVAVEVDKDLAGLAAARLAGAANLDLVVADILADKHHLSAEVRETILRRLAEAGGRLKLVANLPYAVATPLVADLVLGEPRPDLLVFTVQEEVARRMAAAPATAAYGPVSVMVQAVAEVEVRRRLGPTVFWPRPGVGSALVRVRPSAARRGRMADLEALRRTVDGLFRHRRKRAPRSLALADPAGRSPQDWAARLAAIGLDPEARGETYTVDQIVRLANSRLEA
jgi:16S rRNA (adenine1518-N6/adenine1519-N6)-dimethyltransferase